MAEYSDRMETQVKNLPYSLEAEQSVLGGILLKPEIIAEVFTYISRPEMFYRQQHRDLFAVLMNMFNMNRNIDMVTVLEEVELAKVFESTESAKMYLVQLMDLVPTVSNIAEYCRIVQDKYYIRTLMLSCGEILTASEEGESTAADLLELAEQKIYDIRQGRDDRSLTKIDSVLITAYDRLVKMSGEEGDSFRGLKTGFSRVDSVTGGLNKSDLILLAARPGMGKSSFALNIATNVARRYPVDVAVFSLEMSSEQLVTRMLSSEGKIKSEKLRSGRLSAEEWVQISECADTLSRTNIYFDDTAGITVTEIKAKLRRLENLGLVVIDYLQLMETAGRSENRVQEISKLTRSLKIMAKELNVPVLLLSQLSRAAEQRQGHKPMLSDLRDSGSIEQDADIVMFLYREDYYDEETENKSKAQCIVSKNRHGSTGEIDIMWTGEYTRFDEVEYNHEEPY